MIAVQGIYLLFTLAAVASFDFESILSGEKCLSDMRAIAATEHHDKCKKKLPAFDLVQSKPSSGLV
jgi:hypothetical protein